MDAKQRARRRAEAHSLSPAVHVGKEGITPAIVAELERHLRKAKLVKVRLLPAAREGASVREQAEKLAHATGSELVEVRGATAVLHRA